MRVYLVSFLKDLLVWRDIKLILRGPRIGLFLLRFRLCHSAPGHRKGSDEKIYTIKLALLWLL